MAVNKPVGDNARKGAVRKRSQLATKTMGKKTWTKRDRGTGEFIAQELREVFGVVRDVAGLVGAQNRALDAASSMS